MHVRIRVFCLCLCFSFAATGSALANKKGCSEEEAQKAEAQTENLKSWEAVYEFYGSYEHCHDGGVEEGVSNAVAKLLANHWELFPAFVEAAANNKEFEKYVLHHLNATIDWEHDAPKIRENAEHHCPPELSRLCKSLLSRTVPPREMGPR